MVPPSAPTTRPRTTMSSEEQLVRRAVRKQFYRGLTAGNIEFKSAYYIVGPLRTHPGYLDSKEVHLINEFNWLESYLIKTKGLSTIKTRALINKWLKLKTTGKLGEVIRTEFGPTYFTAPQFNKIDALRKSYILHVARMKKRLEIKASATAKRENILGVSINKAKGVAADIRGAMKDIQKNYYAADRGTRLGMLVSGIALVGLVLSSKGAQKFKKPLYAALKAVGLGLAANYLTKLVTGKGLLEMTNSKLDEVQGINNTYKEAFGVRSEKSARLMQDFFIQCGPLKAYDTFSTFLKLREEYGRNGVNQNNRTFDIAGVDMPGRSIYLALTIFDRKHKLHKIIAAMDKVKKEMAARGETFESPPINAIMASILMNEDVALVTTARGVSVLPVRTLSRMRWSSDDMRNTRNYWMWNAATYDWDAHYNHREHLDNLGKYAIDESRPLTDVINEKNIIPEWCKKGFTEANKKYISGNRNPGAYVYIDTNENYAYIISKVDVPHGLRTTREEARRKAVLKAHKQGFAKIDSMYPGKNLNHTTEPVGHIFLRVNNVAKSGVMFLRTALPAAIPADKDKPGSREYNSKINGSWAGGSIMYRAQRDRNNDLLIPGKVTLKFSEAKTILAEYKRRGASSLGAWANKDITWLENKFLSNLGLNRTHLPKIDKVLKYMSNRYSTMYTKRGLTGEILFQGASAVELAEIKRIVNK